MFSSFIRKPFKQREPIVESKYKFYENVSFETAYNALLDGYVVRHPNNLNMVMVMLNKKIFSLNTSKRGSQSECRIIKEFSLSNMKLGTWQIYPPSVFGKEEFLSENF